MVEKAPLFGGTTAYSAGVVWIPGNAQQQAAGIVDSRDAALDYLVHHVGNHLDRSRAEVFLDNAPAMLDTFERLGFTRLRFPGWPIARARRLRWPAAGTLVCQVASAAHNHDGVRRHDDRSQ
jgi:succinate dehydrogenase/fumarate reductase flavoprotein subunit